MADITIHRHGDRWAVNAPGDESPAQEYPTREEAELAARQLAGGATVRVIEDDPTGLDADDSTEPVRTGLEEVKAVDATERARSTQTGM
jgi:Uncharacterized protein conserved in bacteria (DUF2188)